MDPVCVNCHATIVGPCESLAVPDQLPVKSIVTGAGAGAGVCTGAGGDEVGEVVDEPQLDAATTMAARPRSRGICIGHTSPCIPDAFIRV